MFRFTPSAALPIPPAVAVFSSSLVFLLFGLSCGDNVRPPIPATLTSGPVTIETSPLRLRVNSPSGELDGAGFIEVATDATPDEFHFYDPAGDDPTVSWQTDLEVESFEDGRLSIKLDGGQRIFITLSSGPIPDSATLTLDTSEAPHVVLARIVLPHEPGEAVFGFGETFDSPVADGLTREMQLRVDPRWESGLNEVHLPIPLSLWPARGIGMFVDDPRPALFDVGAERPNALLATFTISEPGNLTSHVFVADEPLKLTEQYAALTALPAVPPMWAFAPQQWRNEHNSSDEVRDDAMQMRALDIPGSTMWIDNPWQTSYNSFRFDGGRFENIEALLGELKALGYRVVVWSTPYVNRDGETASDFAEARARDFLVKDNTGRPFVFPWQDGPGALIDFTRDGATSWWQERIARATDLGISGFKLDFGEDLVPELAGSLTPFELAAGTPQTLHAQYAEYYHRAYFDALPDGDAFLITRAGAPRDQAVNPTVWPGDLSSDFSRHGEDNGEGEFNVGGLPAAIAGGLSLSVSGYPFYGSDIGGFRDGPTETETLIRWAQAASLGTIMQLGGGGKSHNPWDETLFGPEALPVYRRYARLHMDLFPTLYTLAKVAGKTGVPVTRPTRFVYPQAASDDMTFLFGDALFVAPVVTEGARNRRVVLPPGQWVDFWTGELFEGDGQTEADVSAPLDTLPLWQKLGEVIALFTKAADTLEPATAAGVTSYADAEFGREITFRLAPSDAPSQVTLFDGSSFSSQKAADGFECEMTDGEQFDIATVELHPTPLAPMEVRAPTAVVSGGDTLLQVTTNEELLACPASPGCWLRNPVTGIVRIRTANNAIRVQ